MPRYFFDMTDGKPYRDGIGQELEDDRAAWREGLRVARDVEDLLAPGGNWLLQVRRDVVVFRIDIRSEWLTENPFPHSVSLPV